MSTRATYAIKSPWSESYNYFYIHYDGYPEGAAMYFRNMIKESKKEHPTGHENFTRIGSGGFPAHFLRGNILAEITESHKTHGDTEYQYTFRGLDQKFTVKARIFGDGQYTEDRWKTLEYNSLTEFIENYKELV